MIFTARCAIVQSEVLQLHVVRLSVCDVGGSQARGPLCFAHAAQPIATPLCILANHLCYVISTLNCNHHHQKQTWSWWRCRRRRRWRWVWRRRRCMPCIVPQKTSFKRLFPLDVLTTKNTNTFKTKLKTFLFRTVN